MVTFTTAGSTTATGPRIQCYSLKSYPKITTPFPRHAAAPVDPKPAASKTTASAAAKATTTTNQFDPYQAQCYSLTSYPRMENIGVTTPATRETAPNSQTVAPPSAPPPYETVIASSVPFPPLPQRTARRPEIIESRVPQPRPQPQPQPLPQQRFSLTLNQFNLQRIGENIGVVRGQPPNQNDPGDTTEVRIALGCCCTGVICCCATGVMCCCTIL